MRSNWQCFDFVHTVKKVWRVGCILAERHQVLFNALSLVFVWCFGVLLFKVTFLYCGSHCVVSRRLSAERYRSVV